jgi:ATPase subunit of ABC transporter with duplicated ATPase domains
MQLEGYQYESKIKTVLHGLNFTEEEFDKPINDFSNAPYVVYNLLNHNYQRERLTNQFHH